MSFAVQAHLLTARYFSACGLNVVRSERIRPVYAGPGLRPGRQGGCIPLHAEDGNHPGKGGKEQSTAPTLFVGVWLAWDNRDPCTPPIWGVCLLLALATPGRSAAGVALHAGAIAHQRVVATFAAGLAFVTLHLGLGARIQADGGAGHSR